MSITPSSESVKEKVSFSYRELDLISFLEFELNIDVSSAQLLDLVTPNLTYHYLKRYGKHKNELTEM